MRARANTYALEQRKPTSKPTIESTPQQPSPNNSHLPPSGTLLPEEKTINASRRTDKKGEEVMLSALSVREPERGEQEGGNEGREVSAVSGACFSGGGEATGQRYMARGFKGCKGLIL